MVQKNCTLVAEIGCSHGGSLSRAVYLTKLAAENGADIVKFQKRNPHVSTPENIKHKAHPNPHFAYGNTYLDHRLKLELSIKDHLIIKDTCKSLKVGYGCSVWDLDSAKDVISISPDLIKIPSACNQNIDLIKYCLENSDNDLHISLGMTDLEDRIELFDRYKGYKSRIIFYHCVSEYPCPFERMHLLGISDIVGGGFRAAFSNHGYGIACDIAAMMLGAEFDERHFIDDRAFRHTDAAASLEPEGLKKLRRDLDAVYASLTPRINMTEEELVQSRKLKSRYEN